MLKVGICIPPFFEPLFTVILAKGDIVVLKLQRKLERTEGDARDRNGESSHGRDRRNRSAMTLALTYNTGGYIVSVEG